MSTINVQATIHAKLWLLPELLHIELLPLLLFLLQQEAGNVLGEVCAPKDGKLCQSMAESSLASSVCQCTGTYAHLAKSTVEQQGVRSAPQGCRAHLGISDSDRTVYKPREHKVFNTSRS